MRSFLISTLIMVGVIPVLILYNHYFEPILESAHIDSTYVLIGLYFLIFFTILLIAIFQYKREGKALNEFTQTYGYVIGGDQSVSFDSCYIRAGESPYTQSIRSREFKGAGIAIYDCSVVMGALSGPRSPDGKNDLRVLFSTCEITVSCKLPKIFLKSKLQGCPDTLWNVDLSDMEPLTLEGNFDKYFSVWTEKYKNSDALTFLTPNVMEGLITYGTNFHIEVEQNKLFIHSSHIEREPKKLEAINTLAEYLVGLCVKM